MEKVYTKDTLKTLQTIELSILKEFDDICSKNDIDYFLCGGSSIGVVRHGGFIPWDDDIDVGMARKDYDKFLEIANRQYAHKYTVMNNETNPHFPLMNTRWGLNGTKFIPMDFKDIKGEFGIFLDIFCFDNIPDEEDKMKSQGSKAWFWGKLLVMSGVKNPVLYVYGWKATVLKYICKIGHYVLRLLHLKPTFFYRKAKKYISEYTNTDTKRMAYMFDPQKFTSIVSKKDIYPTKRMKFENIMVNVPANIEQYLTKRYGDYMKLPPEDKRHIHPPYILELGKAVHKES